MLRAFELPVEAVSRDVLLRPGLGNAFDLTTTV